MAALAAGLMFFLAAPPAAAEEYQPVETVHTERVQVGPYGVTVGFSTWPIRAMRSLDFTFVPDGGITGKRGSFDWVAPTGATAESGKLSRHPRKREVWGLDILALNTEGNWALRFTMDGPQGPATGVLRNLAVLEQPGPPLPLSWGVSVLPLAGIVAFLVIGWRRNGRLALATPGRAGALPL
ncbi:hypothetical protein DP939_18900 [Spongiactinospora rosea]|uniref:Uncharacterized protein n=2 Tax=Spongiactinospora rosea TaxID=2248750 RepID=A0A366LZF0_9ACTN|nr:hypothetical protein DP939_18900 [Spongiactinospora rosea]